jgi:predicted transcriptional regulator
MYGSLGVETIYHLTVNEREVIRYALRLNRPIELEDVKFCLQMGKTSSIKILKNLWDKSLIKPVGDGIHRIHAYELEDKARNLML